MIIVTFLGVCPRDDLGVAGSGSMSLRSLSPPDSRLDTGGVRTMERPPFSLLAACFFLNSSLVLPVFSNLGRERRY